MEAAADIAVAAVGALPPLGFVHEQSSNAFTLDIADMWRTEVTLPLAFGCARTVLAGTAQPLEREVRLEAARLFRRYQLIPKMIDRIKSLLDTDDNHSDSNVSARIRGFLGSSMLELGPGVYSAPRFSPAVRERIWTVLADWFQVEGDASIVMVWTEPGMPGGQDVRTLGLPPVEVVEIDGLLVARR